MENLILASNEFVVQIRLLGGSLKPQVEVEITKYQFAHNGQKKNMEKDMEKLTARLDIRVTPSEKNLVTKKAAFCNMKYAEYVRKIIKENLIIVEDNSHEERIIYELNKIGININQIARVVNLNGNINDDEMKELLNYKKEIQSLLLKRKEDRLMKEIYRIGISINNFLEIAKRNELECDDYKDICKFQKRLIEIIKERDKVNVDGNN